MRVAAIAAALALLASTARAENKKKEADELFKRAKKLLAEKHYAEACAKFETSYRLDPGIGGELNVGRCYEEWGKLARAYHAYVDAEQQAKAAEDARLDKIHALVVGLEPQVPRLIIHVPAAVDTSTLDLTIDGVHIAANDLANPQLVDPGPKEVEYQSGGVKKSKLIPVERGGTSEITLEGPKQVVAEPAHTDVKPAPSGDGAGSDAHPVVVTHDEDHVGRTQRIGGIAVGAVGVVGVAIGGYLALSARSKYNDAISADCMGSKNMCDPIGLTATQDARSQANIATFVIGGGIAAIAGGVVLFLLAPSAATGEHAYYVAPTGTGIAFGGRL